MMTASTPTVWWHGTSEEAWATIQEEGVLWGRRGPGVGRCTYLAVDRFEAECHGPVVLRVEHDVSQGTNNYCQDCWQIREYEAIPITRIQRVDGGP